jgi:hypothetical protein
MMQFQIAAQNFTWVFPKMASWQVALAKSITMT